MACSWNTNEILVGAWMLSGDRMLLEHERNYGLRVDVLVTECNPIELCVLLDGKVTRWY